MTDGHDEQTEALAQVLDPEAFEDHPAERRREFAALQWGARRHMARAAAAKAVAVGWLSPAEVAAQRAEWKRAAAEKAWDYAWHQGFAAGLAKPHTTVNPYRAAAIRAEGTE